MPVHRRLLFSRLSLEELEDRLLLTTLAPPYFPAAIRTAYGLTNANGTNQVLFGNTAADGTGQTIAILELNNVRTAQQLQADLHTFDVNASVNLADAPSLSVFDAPGVTPTSATTDVIGEEDLDMEWAHAMAPGANIDIVMVPVVSGTAELSQIDAAAQYAASLPGVSVVSISYDLTNRSTTGAPQGPPAFPYAPDEYASETADDSMFTTPAGHQGVTFVASAGDDGVASWPATSPNVLSVGGTTLNLTTVTNTATPPVTTYAYGSEVYWNSPAGGTFASGLLGMGGAGLSQFEPEPAYQENFQTSGSRSVPDVAMDADYDTTPLAFFIDDPLTGQNGMTSMGPSSGLSAQLTAGMAGPMMAGLLADVNQGRVLAGGTTLDGRTQTLPALYSLPSGDFNAMSSVTDIPKTTISATGLGSPKANLLIPALASYELANKLVVTNEPTSVAAGAVFPITLQAADALGAVDTSANGPVLVNGNETQTITFGSPLTTAASGTFDLVVDGVTVPVAYPATASQANMVAAIQTAMNDEVSPLGAGTTLVAAGITPSTVSITFMGSLTNVKVPQITSSNGTLGGNSVSAAAPQVITFANPLTTQAFGFFSLLVDGVTVSIPFPFPASQANMVAAIQTALDGSAAPLGPGTTLEAAGPSPSMVTITYMNSLANATLPQIAFSNGTLSTVQIVTFANPLTAGAAGSFSLVVDGVTIPIAYPAPASQANMVTAVQAALDGAAAPLGMGTTSVTAASDPSSIYIQFLGALATSAVPTITFSNGTLAGTSIASSGVPNGISGIAGTMMANGVATIFVTAPQTASNGASEVLAADNLKLQTYIKALAGGVSQLSITTEPPASVSAGMAFGFTVTELDSFGNVATGATGSVSLALANNPNSATLGGNLSQAFVNGVAAFSGLSISNGGIGYTLSASTAGIASVVTSAINVFSTLVITGAPNDNVTVAFADAQDFTVTKNGVETQYSLAKYDRLVYQGPNHGFSSVIFDDPKGTYTATQTLTSTQVISSAFDFEADNVANLYIYAGSASTANVTVTTGTGANFYVDAASGGYSYIADPVDGIFSQLIGFGAETVTGSGGSTYAYIYSTSKASIVADPASSSVTVGGVETTLAKFSQMYILGAADGTDQVNLEPNNSVGAEFVGTPTFSYITGAYKNATYIIGALYSANVVVQPSIYDTDTAFFESFPNNAFNGGPASSALTGTATNTSADPSYSYSFSVQANGYLATSVLESGSGTDTVNLTSSGRGVFVATSTVDTLTIGLTTITVNTYVSTSSGSGTVLVPAANRVNVIGAGDGSDSAFLYDSPGGNAVVASGTTATLTTNKSSVTVNKFGTLTIERQNGSSDTLHEGAVDFLVSTVGNWTSV